MNGPDYPNGVMYTHPTDKSITAVGWWHNPNQNEWIEVTWGYDQGLDDAEGLHHPDFVLNDPARFGVALTGEEETDEILFLAVNAGWNRIYIDSRGWSCIDSATMKSAHRSIRALVQMYPQLNKLLIDVQNQSHHVLQGDSLEFFIRKGSVPRNPITESYSRQGLPGYWHNPQTNEWITVPDGLHHQDVALNDPEKFGVSDDPSVYKHRVQAIYDAMEAGWNRVILDTGSMSYAIETQSLRTARVSLKRLMQDHPEVQKGYIEDHGQGEGFHVEPDQMDTFLRRGVIPRSRFTEGVYSYYYPVYPNGMSSDDDKEIWSLRSRSDLMRALKASDSQNELRGLLHDDLVVAWDSYHEVHGGIIDVLDTDDEQHREHDPGHVNLNLDWRGQIYLYPNGVALAPKRENDIEYVRNHPVLKRIYQSEVVPIVQALSETEPLNEMHYTDLYPEQFEAFHKKYRNLIRKQGLYDIYVQFTNYQGDKLDRTAYESPDHHDPMGIYTYPLRYVLNYPADIWYGSKAKYLRVIRATPRNPLYYKGMNWDDVRTILFRMGTTELMGDRFENLDKYIKWVKKHNGHKGKYAPQKTLMSAFQMDYSEDPTEVSWGEEKYPIRSAKKQTELLMRAGYDAVVDENTGSMNEREPEQAVFLTRASFRVEEIFELRGEGNPVLTVNNPGDTDSARKFAQMIAQEIQDKLVRGVETTNQNGWRRFWTKKGNQISVRIDKPDRYYDDLSFGEKRHRYYKKETDHIIRVEMETDRGRIEYQTGKRDIKLQDVAFIVGQKYRAGEPIVDWAPQTRESWLQAEKDANTLDLINRERKDRNLPLLGSIDEYKALRAKGLNAYGEKQDNPKIQKAKANLSDYKQVKEYYTKQGESFISYRQWQKLGNYDGVMKAIKNKPDDVRVVDWLYKGGLLEAKMVGAAIKDTQTGKIYGPDVTHYDVTWKIHDELEIKPDDWDKWYGDTILNDALVDGFLDSDGKFYNREEAARAVRLDPKEKGREWLDAEDIWDEDNAQITESRTDHFQGKNWIHTSGKTISVSTMIGHDKVATGNPTRFGWKRDEIGDQRDYNLFMSTIKRNGWIRADINEYHVILDGHMERIREFLQKYATTFLRMGDIEMELEGLRGEWVQIRNRIEFRRFIQGETRLAETDENGFGEDGFWGDQGAGIIIMSGDTGRILLPKRSEKVEEPGTWGTWGGAIDSGEEPLGAAVREVQEETHIRILQNQIKPLYVFRKGEFKYYNYLALVEGEPDPELNWETETARWVKLDELPSPLHFGLKAVLDDPESMQVIRKYSQGNVK